MYSLAPHTLPRTSGARFLWATKVSNAKEHEGRLLAALSPREREVLVLVVEGRTSKEISRVIGVKPSTIDTYRSRIMTKLGVRGVPALVRLAVRFGLIDLRSNDRPRKGGE